MRIRRTLLLMIYFYPSYVRAFIKFADFHLFKSIAYLQIVIFAKLLTEKATQLVKRASLNRIDACQLQKELFELGRNYINRFAMKFKSLDGKIPEMGSKEKVEC